MAKLIDGAWESFLLNMNPLLLKDFQEGRAGLGALRTAIEEQLTLVQSNTSLTCSGCKFEFEMPDEARCEQCIRAPAFRDCYSSIEQYEEFNNFERSFNYGKIFQIL